MAPHCGGLSAAGDEEAREYVFTPTLTAGMRQIVQMHAKKVLLLKAKSQGPKDGQRVLRVQKPAGWCLAEPRAAVSLRCTMCEKEKPRAQFSNVSQVRDVDVRCRACTEEQRVRREAWQAEMRRTCPLTNAELLTWSKANSGPLPAGLPALQPSVSDHAAREG